MIPVTYRPTTAARGPAIVVVRFEGEPGHGRVFRGSTIADALDKAARVMAPRKASRMWPAGAIELVRERYGVHTATEIAATLRERFPGRKWTRNMVIGRGNRLGLGKPK